MIESLIDSSDMLPCGEFCEYYYYSKGIIFNEEAKTTEVSKWQQSGNKKSVRPKNRYNFS